MSFFLVFIGLMLIVSAVRGTHQCLIALIESEFSGPGNFFYWVAAVLILGLIGYSDTLRPLSKGLLVVIVLALFLTTARNGLFNQVKSIVSSTASPIVQTGS